MEGGGRRAEDGGGGRVAEDGGRRVEGEGSMVQGMVERGWRRREEEKKG
jgi:hypothetical protein